MKHLTKKSVALFVAGGLGLFGIWKFSAREKSTSPPPRPVVEKIPPGIVVTEASTPAPSPPPASGSAPGDRLLENYANPSLPAQDDLILISRAISNFFLINKQSAQRPLSANEEWSATLRGKRPGAEPWLSEKSPAFDGQQRLIDRWGSPLHFHALGNKQWEIRSAGPDRKLWTADDLLEKTSG